MLSLKLPNTGVRGARLKTKGKRKCLYRLYSYRKMTWMCSEVQKVGEQGTGGRRF